MPPSKNWDDEEDNESSGSDTAPAPVARRSKFDDEEAEEDVLDSWDAAEDSEHEREKAKKASEVAAKAAETAKANHKSKSERIEEKRMAAMQRRQEMEDMSSDSEEDEATKRERLRQMEKEADLRNAADLFSDIGVNKNRSAARPVTLADPTGDPTQTLDLSSLRIFNPSNRDGFMELRETLTPLIAANSKKAQYTTFLPEFVKGIVADLSSEQIKKIASGLTAVANEKLKEEKEKEKGGKKSKAAKAGKVTLNASRGETVRADTNVYDDGLDDGDFM